MKFDVGSLGALGMESKNWAIWIPLVLAAIQTFYAIATFHRDQLKLSIKNRPLLVMAVFTALSWAATYVNYRMIPSPAEGQLVDYGTDGPNIYHGVGVFKNWVDYKDYRALLITRTVFSDRDRMTDNWIAKSIPYTINGPSIVMALVSNGTMRYGISRPNLIEFNFVVLPEKISPDQIRTLGDIEKFGGKILSSAGQGGIMGGPPEQK